MVGPFALDGYDVLGPLGGSQRSWRAVCLADGRRVVLRRCFGAAGRLAEVRRRAALWGSIAGRGVVAVRDVVPVGNDLVIVSDLGEGGGLDGLLARRGGLTPGQVVTLVAPLAETLAAAHDRGLTHGRVTAGNVVLDADGRPRLTDHVFDADGQQSADLAALVALARGCLDSDAPAALLDALGTARDARGLGQHVLVAAAAEPLTFCAAWSAPATATQPLGRRSNVRITAAAVVAAVVTAIAAGMWWGRHQPAAGAELPPAPAVRPSVAALPTETSSSPRPPLVVALPQVVRELERRRLHALARADVSDLAAVEVRGTALWRGDMRSLSRLVREHLRLRGLRADVLAVHVLSSDARRAVVRVVDRMSAYDVVDVEGAVVAHRAARPARAVNLVLVRDGKQWRIRNA